MLSINGPIITHPVLMTLLGITLLVRKEGANSHTRLTEDRDNERSLDFIM